MIQTLKKTDNVHLNLHRLKFATIPIMIRNSLSSKLKRLPISHGNNIGHLPQWEYIILTNSPPGDPGAQKSEFLLCPNMPLPQFLLYNQIWSKSCSYNISWKRETILGIAWCQGSSFQVFIEGHCKSLWEGVRPSMGVGGRTIPDSSCIESLRVSLGHFRTFVAKCRESHLRAFIVKSQNARIKVCLCVCVCVCVG